MMGSREMFFERIDDRNPVNHRIRPEIHPRKRFLKRVAHGKPSTSQATTQPAPNSMAIWTATLKCSGNNQEDTVRILFTSDLHGMIWLYDSLVDLSEQCGPDLIILGEICCPGWTNMEICSMLQGTLPSLFSPRIV
jgi:hypothetical protein